MWRTARHPAAALEPYGNDKAKLDAAFIKSLDGRSQGKLILVTAINPTKAGEGKTTTTIGLGDGLSRIGKKTAIACASPASVPVSARRAAPPAAARPRSRRWPT